MSETTSDRLLGTKEAAAFYGVNVPNFIRDWAARPDFPQPAAIVSGRRIWHGEDLLAYRASAGPKRGARPGQLQLSAPAAKWLPVTKRRIVRRFHPERIILFGSQARGEARPDSDADLIVVMSEASDPRAIAREINATLRGIPLATDILVTTPERLVEDTDLIGTVFRPAVREGITIYSRR
jgi:predicted nucleotidyltransferase